MNINKILNNLIEPTINKLFYKKKENKNINQMIHKYKNGGTSYLKTLNADDLYEIFNYINRLYKNNSISCKICKKTSRITSMRNHGRRH